MKLRIGTRGSELALVQTAWVAQQLENSRSDIETEIVRIKTSGDLIRDVPLARVGGKGLFVKEIEAALLSGDIDCAVHSMKDVPGEMAEGLAIAAVPVREDPRDVVIGREMGRGIRPGPDGGSGGRAVLRRGMRVGTCSPRRAAQLRDLGLDLEVVPLRGNVGTRVAKVQSGEVDATLLAVAGLRRLGIDPPLTEVLDADRFVPAVGQGALAIQTRVGELVEVVGAIEDPISRIAADAERALLRRMGGNCVTPLAALARVAGNRVRLIALIAHPSGEPILRDEAEGPCDRAAELGVELAERMLSAGGAELLTALDETL